MKIRESHLEFPLIQGGMGVGVSLSNLAGSVMKEGCMGVISAAHPGYKEENFFSNSLETNLEALQEECKKAKEISLNKGLLGVNIMCASKHYKDYVQCAIEAKADAIISGAGLPLSLPEYVKGSSILIAPIVSSGKAAELICKRWSKKYNRIPDFIVIESSLAGGHLGFQWDDLQNQTCQNLDDIIMDVREVIKKYEDQYQYRIPIFAAGGIFDSKDMKRVLYKGADGVQIGTRFIATYECDAHPNFKEAIIKAKKEDIVFVKSPTGFPGRAIQNDFVKNRIGNTKVDGCINCLIPCNPANTPYCISRALIEAVKGNVENGLIFVGRNADRITSMTSVKEIIDEFKTVWRKS